MRIVSRLFAAVLFLAIALTGTHASAITFCVTNGPGGAAQLDDDLRYWQNASDETVYIHLEQGTYTMLASGDNYYPSSFFYDQSGLSQGTGNLGNASLHLVGGFVPGTSPACKQRVLDPSNTTINGKNGGSNSSLTFYQRDGQTLIDGLTFTAFGNGVYVSSYSDSSITVRNVILSGNGNGDFNYSALTVADAGIFGGSSVLRVENCLIVDNNLNGLAITDDHDGDTTQVIGCTIANNSGYGLVVGDAYDDDLKLNGALSVFNTIFRGNGFADIFVSATGNTPNVRYSNYASVSGAAVNHSNNQNTDPHFVPGQYQLQTDSPFINGGAPESLISGGYAGTDIRNRTRVIGTRADFGPYETLVDDSAAQTVDTISDLPTGNTLRAAVTTANFNANPTTIKFNITSGSCPHVIDLGSLLPDITSDVTIDGYTEPGAVPNSVVPGYDGTICIVLRGGGLDHAFKTSGSGRLTVRGFEFENFSTAAIRLSSGSGHIVNGNGFSAFPFASPMKDGVLIEGTTTSSQIGSYAFGDRNVFAQSTDAAIKLATNGVGKHVIQGNYIGFNLDGTKRTDEQNKYGIYLQDSGSNEISYNFIGDSQLDAIELAGANTSANHIVENAIGVAPADNAAAGGGAGTCNPLCFGSFAAVEVTSGAHGNFVGALGGSGGNNLIVNNYGPGVEIESSAGTGNRVYGNNLIHDNGGYLAIDLGAQGPTVNDVSDTDFGGNNLQNYPTLSQALRIEAGVVRTSGSLVAQRVVAPQVYRLDVYWTDSCLFSGSGSDTPRGDMKRYVGFLYVNSNGTEFNLPFSSIDIVASKGLPTPGYLFATATDAAGNTSEPGPCHTFTDDYIFSNGFN